MRKSGCGCLFQATSFSSGPFHGTRRYGFIRVLVDGVLISFIRNLFCTPVLVLASVSLLSFASTKPQVCKEFCGALLYSVGVTSSAWSLSPDTLSLSQGMFIAEFCITVLCNLLLFSLFDIIMIFGTTTIRSLP